MILALLILIPAVGGLAAFFISHVFARRSLLVTAALLHAALTAFCWIRRPEPILYKWIDIDAPGLLFLTVSSILFLAASIYAISYLRNEPKEQQDSDEGFFFTNTPENIFIACLQLFLSTMTLVCVSHHFGMLWVAIEATTLASAPLIFFHRHHRSLEATWKYVLICSIGIGLALLGTLMLTVSASKIEDNLTLSKLIASAQLINPAWLDAAFILFLVGYGTKMGLAPLHTWLPAAHGESPSLVSALLSGALLNCSFLGILRLQQVCVSAGNFTFSSQMLVVFGLFSMGVAAAFIIGQKDFKRMLAYSSVEHMGILSLGIGLGGTAVFASMYHLVNHSLTKGMLFLAAGNIIAFYKTRTSSEVKGILHRIPATGVLWTVGLFAIAGFPPFGLFVSEFSIFMNAFYGGHYFICSIFLLLLAIIFAGMSYSMLNMAQGEKIWKKEQESKLSILPPAVLGIATLVLGIWIPGFLMDILNEISVLFGAL